MDGSSQRQIQCSGAPLLVGDARIQRKNSNNVEEHIPKYGNAYLAIRFDSDVSNCRGVWCCIDWTPRSVPLHPSGARLDWFRLLTACIGLRALRNDRCSPLRSPYSFPGSTSRMTSCEFSISPVRAAKSLVLSNVAIRPRGVPICTG